MENFLAVHTSYAAELPPGREPSAMDIEQALTREGKPSWTEEDFQGLLHTLACAGYGWLRPEGVRRKLEAAQRKAEDEERKRQEEEDWNRSLRGRIANLFTGKGK